MIVCDRDTCAHSDRRDALASLPFSEDFVANLLHLKCKVVQLARSQMQKESTRWRERTMNAEMGRIVGSCSTVHEQAPREENVAIDASRSTGVAQAPGNIKTPEEVAPAAATSEAGTDSIRRWTKTIFAGFPLCWTILAIGILGLASLACGVLLGAFVCTHGTHRLPAFLRLNSRVGRAVY